MLPARILAQDEPPPLINEKVLRGIGNLPVLPLVWQKLLACLEDPWSSLGDMETLIRQEAALSTLVLSRANSSYYGLSGRVTSVQMALQVLGLQEVRRLCLSGGLDQVLRASKLYKQSEGQLLWRHGLQTAEAAFLLAKELARPDCETAFACGLLHDLGKVLLVACFPLAYQSVRQIQQRQGLTWLGAEKCQNLDHQYLGRYLAQRWGLPPLLAEVIGQHHQPDPQQEFWEMAALIHIADTLARGLDQPEPWPLEAGDRALWNFCLRSFNLDQTAMAGCRDRLHKRLEEVGAA
jgi:putative nucleotidyltransferase with HDIG domain